MKTQTVFRLATVALSLLAVVVPGGLSVLGQGQPQTLEQRLAQPSWLNLENSKFESISLQRMGGCMSCPVDELTFRTNGTAFYNGQLNVERIGRFEGRVARRDIAKLLRFVDESGFVNLEEGYALQIRDDALNRVTVGLKSGKEKGVSYRPNDEPSALWIIHQAILGVASTVRWHPATDATPHAPE